MRLHHEMEKDHRFMLLFYYFARQTIQKMLNRNPCLLFYQDTFCFGECFVAALLFLFIHFFPSSQMQ